MGGNEGGAQRKIVYERAVIETGETGAAVAQRMYGNEGDQEECR